MDDLQKWWGALDGGDKPTWLAAVFAGLAFLFTARTVWNSEQDRRRRERREETEQAQYVKVSQVTSGPGVRRGDIMEVTFECTVSNESSDTIHDVSVRLEVHPASAVVEGGALHAQRILFASEHAETFAIRPKLHCPGGKVASATVAPEVEFTDIRGRRWRRDREYRLTQISR